MCDANKAIITTNAVATAEGAGCPVGIPDELFNLLQPPAVNSLITDTAALPQQVLDEMKEPQTCKSSDFQSYLDYICTLNNC